MTSSELETDLSLWERLKEGKSAELDSTFLFRDPTVVLTTLGLYISFVLFFGPRWMRDRKPYNLKSVIIVYNALQVYYNFWMLKTPTSDRLFWKYFFSLSCGSAMSPEDQERYDYHMYAAFWHGTANKMLDLLDTVFFVLCKKQSHVTFLHVQHHVLSVFILWSSAKYLPGPEYQMIFLANITVHMIMYFYYLLAALGPEYKKYLWWKKHLTLIQIIQLIAIIAYSAAGLWFSCGHDNRIHYVLIGNCTLNLVLFLKFYFKTYSNTLMQQKMAVCGSLQINGQIVPEERELSKDKRDENENEVKNDNKKDS